MVVQQEPIEGLGWIGEIAGWRSGQTGLQELHQRGFAGIVDIDIAISLHRRDEAIFGAVRRNVLGFEVETQAICRIELQSQRHVFGRSSIFALEAQQFGWDAATASKGLKLGQSALGELIACERSGRTRCDDWEQSVVIDQSQSREFFQSRFCGCFQIFKRGQPALVIAFPLPDNRHRIAVTG